MPPHETRIRVRYAETDQMGVVYYANYLVWMEVGRVEYCKACGFEYKQMELEDGVFLAVAEARCRYASPARFDEEVVIRTWVEEANPRMVLFAYEMRLSADGRKLATGETKHIFLGRDLRPCRMPEKYRGKFGIHAPGTNQDAGAGVRIRAGRHRGGGSGARGQALRPVDLGRDGWRDALFNSPGRRVAGRCAAFAAVRPVDSLRGQALQRAAALLDAIRRRGSGVDLALRVGRGLPPGAAARTGGRGGWFARGVAGAVRVEDLRGHCAAAGARLRTACRTGLDRQEHLPH